MDAVPTREFLFSDTRSLRLLIRLIDEKLASMEVVNDSTQKKRRSSTIFAVAAGMAMPAIAAAATWFYAPLEFETFVEEANAFIVSAANFTF